MPEEDLETAELKERVGDALEGAAAIETRPAPPWMTHLSLSTALIAVFAAVASLQSGANSNDAILEKNEAVLNQSKASDQWAYYQAKGVKAALAANAADVASDSHPAVIGKLRDEASRYKLEQDAIERVAHELENQVVAHNELAAHLLERHHRFALSVTVFQIAIALSAIAALTRQKTLWFVALVASAAALLVFVTGQVI